MKKSAILAIDGVFLAVKCKICGTVYAADSDEYIAFYGNLQAGLGDVIVDVDPPQRPAKKSLTAVCREPKCVGTVVRQMLGATGDKGDALWSQVLKIWADDAGADVLQLTPPTLKPKQKLKAKARRSSSSS